MDDIRVAGSTGKLVTKQSEQEPPPGGLDDFAVARWFSKNPQLAYSATILFMGTVGYVRQTIYFDTFGITYIAYAGLTDMVVASVEILVFLLFATAAISIFGILILGYFVLVMAAAVRMGYAYTASGAGILKPFLHPGREFNTNIKSEWDLVGQRFRTTHAGRKEIWAIMRRRWTRAIFGFLRNGRAFSAFIVFLLLSIGFLSGLSARGLKYCKAEDAHLHAEHGEFAGAGLFCHFGDQPGEESATKVAAGTAMPDPAEILDQIGIPNLFRSMFERPLVKLTLGNGDVLPEPYIMLGSTSSHSFFYGPIEIGPTEEGTERLALVIRRDSLSIIRAYTGAPAHDQKTEIHQP